MLPSVLLKYIKNKDSEEHKKKRKKNFVSICPRNANKNT